MKMREGVIKHQSTANERIDWMLLRCQGFRVRWKRPGCLVGKVIM